MNTFDIENETELTAEIDDLSEYLRGIPADLRESGAFAPYEVRLQHLLETLLTFRLKQTLRRYEPALANDAVSHEQRAVYDEIRQWLRAAEDRHEQAAQDYLRVTGLLSNLVAALDHRRL
ncbi:MAG TPA: hypothetical protein VFP80_00075 [Thermoanaerobaculia bacterium]|nr:hypothetical protein [Thermoanaerobaculia bacterium]